MMLLSFIVHRRENNQSHLIEVLTAHKNLNVTLMTLSGEESYTIYPNFEWQINRHRTEELSNAVKNAFMQEVLDVRGKRNTVGRKIWKAKTSYIGVQMSKTC